MSETRIFKKYANRRLYDTAESRYVTLGEVADLIKTGIAVQVLDAKTAEDVTGSILTQVILEEARQKNVLLPVPVLHLIIRYGDNLLAEFFEKYFQLTVKNYLAYKDAFDQQFRTWLNLGKDMSDFSKAGMPDMEPFKSFFSFSDKKSDAGKDDKESD